MQPLAAWHRHGAAAPGSGNGETAMRRITYARTPRGSRREGRESAGGKTPELPEGFMITVSPINTSADLCQTP